MTQEPESKPKLTWEEKITDILLKAIMTGGVIKSESSAQEEMEERLSQ